MWKHHLTQVTGEDGLVYYRNEWGPDSKPVIVRKLMTATSTKKIECDGGCDFVAFARNEQETFGQMQERLNKTVITIARSNDYPSMHLCRSCAKRILKELLKVGLILLLLVTPCFAQQRSRIIVGEPIYLGTPYFPYPPVYYAWPRGRSSWQHQRYAARRELYRAKNAKLNAKDTPRR